MWNEPTARRLAQVPGLYRTEDVPLQDKLIWLHFFIAGCDWYVVEYDPREKLFWGFAILNGDYLNAEWGYISFGEMREILVNGIEIDCEREEFWKVRPAGEVDKICQANGWPRPSETSRLSA